MNIDNFNDKKNIICELCPRNCAVNRTEKYGYCKSKGLRIARYGMHLWEEPCISGENGSGTIFFSGCSLRCIYCQNYEVSQYSKGYDITVDRLVEIIKELERQGANNINFVTPTHFATDIIKALDIYRPNIPICYNTSGYEKIETLNLLAKYVDIFLTDFKYADENLANKYSKAKDYPIVAEKAILKMREIVPNDIYSEDGMMQKGIIVRHLVLPNCLENSKKVLDWIAKNLGNDTVVSLMSQYTPYGKANEDDVINRKLKPIEYKIIQNYALKLGFDNAYVQESSSSDECFIPEFYGKNLIID